MGADGTTQENFRRLESTETPEKIDPYEIGLELGKKVREAIDGTREAFQAEVKEPLQEIAQGVNHGVKVHTRLARQDLNRTKSEVKARLAETARKAKDLADQTISGKVTQEFTETLTPLSLPTILHSIEKRLIAVHDLYHGKPEYLYKLQQTLDEIYYAYADAGNAPNLGAQFSKFVAKMAMFFESEDLDDVQARTYKNASEFALKEKVGKRLQDEMKRDLESYLAGRDHTSNTGETVRSDSDYRMLGNLLLFLNHWNERQRELGERSTDPLLSESRIQELLTYTMGRIQDEIVLISSSIEVDSGRQANASPRVPIDEHERRMLALSPTEKSHRLFELQRLADELLQLDPKAFSENHNKLPLYEGGGYEAVLQNIVASFALDTYFGAKDSETFSRHFEHVPSDQLLDIPRELLPSLAHMPLSELISYCNDMAKSGILDTLTEGSFGTTRGEKKPNDFDKNILDRIRGYLKAHGQTETDALIQTFSEDAREVLGIDRLMQTIQSEVPLDATTPSGFITFAKRILIRIPERSPKRLEFLNDNRENLRDMFVGLWETGGIEGIARFGNELIEIGLVDGDSLTEMVFGKKGFLPKFSADFKKRVMSLADIDMKSALSEFHSAGTTGFSEYQSPTLVRNLQEKLQAKVKTALTTRGSADTVSFLDELQPYLVGDSGIMRKKAFEELREDVLYDDASALNRPIALR